MNIKTVIITLLAIGLNTAIIHARDKNEDDPKYLELRDSLHRSFNNDDRFIGIRCF